ncbi:unnamed protein product [Ectocarpus sp. 13 AM-2016]
MATLSTIARSRAKAKIYSRPPLKHMTSSAGECLFAEMDVVRKRVTHAVGGAHMTQKGPKQEELKFMSPVHYAYNANATAGAAGRAGSLKTRNQRSQNPPGVLLLWQ